MMLFSFIFFRLKGHEEAVNCEQMDYRGTIDMSCFVTMPDVFFGLVHVNGVELQVNTPYLLHDLIAKTHCVL